MLEELKRQLNEMIEQNQNQNLLDVNIIAKSQELDKLIVEVQKQNKKHPELQLLSA